MRTQDCDIKEENGSYTDNCSGRGQDLRLVNIVYFSKDVIGFPTFIDVK